MTGCFELFGACQPCRGECAHPKDAEEGLACFLCVLWEEEGRPRSSSELRRDTEGRMGKAAGSGSEWGFSVLGTSVIILAVSPGRPDASPRVRTLPIPHSQAAKAEGSGSSNQ